VQIPKFADPPPLAIDVCSDESTEVARAAADRLKGALEKLGWRIRDPRPGES
jgi:hypothetical protein